MWLLAFLSPASAADPCPEGKQRAGLEQALCCWPGQVWTGSACKGQPVCPEGLRVRGRDCTDRPKPPRRPQVERRLTLLSGYEGSMLFVDDEPLGRLPIAAELPLGEHLWYARDLSERVIATGQFKVRAGDGNQILVLEPPPPKEP